MAAWSRRALLIVFAAYGLLGHFVPSEPFLTPYLIDVKGFPEDVVNNRIYPVWTYAYLAFLAVVGPAAELVGYKPVIVTGALAVVTTRALLVWATTLPAMQAMQVTYGLSTAIDVVFYTYIYRLVEAGDYQRVTSVTRASVLLGYVCSGLVGQGLVSFGDTPLMVLFQISFGVMVAATLVALALPGASAELRQQPKLVDPLQAAPVTDVRSALARMHGAWTMMVAVYRRPDVASWSVWWVLALCGVVAVEGYASSLWYALDPTANLNGFVDAGARLAAAGTACLPLLLPPALAPLWVHAIVLVGSALTVVWSVASALSARVVSAYVLYVFFEATLYGMIALVAAQLARRMGDEHFALVFATNTFGALAVFAVLQAIISALGLDIFERFWVYTGIFSCLALVAAGDMVVRLAQQAGLLPSTNNDAPPDDSDVPYTPL